MAAHIVDFVCLDRWFIVELDGGIHNVGENPELDKERTLQLEALGFTVLRYPNDVILCTIEMALYEIREALLANAGDRL